MFVLESCNFCNDINLPIDSGSFLKLPHPWSERNWSCVSSPIEIGSFTIYVPDRSSNDRCFALPTELGKLVIFYDDITNLDNDANFPKEYGNFSILFTSHPISSCKVRRLLHQIMSK
ncbi:hypothetical protein BT93_E2047 [Corymbia citriodora subsp. variegata]|nr:hypothetical protein BT93_E2047 [Corymbia citriodora subsp. variegata]